MRKLTIWLLLIIILCSVFLAIGAKKKPVSKPVVSATVIKDRAAAQKAFDLVGSTFDSWFLGLMDLPGQQKIRNRYLQLDKLIGPDGVDFILIVPEIKIVNKKSVCVVSTENHNISASTFHKAIEYQYQITCATSDGNKLPSPLNDKEVTLLGQYIDNYNYGFPQDEGDSSSATVVVERKSIGEWSCLTCYWSLPTNTPVPKDHPTQRTKFIKNNSGVWQIDEIQIFMITNIRKDL